MFTHLLDEVRVAASGVRDFAGSLVAPTVRIGVTGLSRSGKTVFITALVHALLNGGRLPLFTAHAQGRIYRAYLEPQPDLDVPRFAYEDHVDALTGPGRTWPKSTSRLSQLRLTLEYEATGIIARNFQRSRLHLDIVDYPGEWLLDLPLLAQTYEQWSARTIAASRRPPRDRLANEWNAFLAGIDPKSDADEAAAQKAAKLFTAYLARCREDDVSLSTLPPGRFLMPGDLAGSPLLTFAPLRVEEDATPANGSLHALMRQRYDAYVSRVVKPFFFEHFARLDRQIVLVDTLTALNAGADALTDLKGALSDVLGCFRQGANSLVSTVFGRRVDRILFAATKADLLHHTSHDRLEAILKVIVDDAMQRAEFAGATIDVAAIAAIRATREATVKQDGETLQCIAGVPVKGEQVGDQVFDGRSEVAIFPGDLPEDADTALDGTLEGELKFVRFRPPEVHAGDAANARFPHIRLDRTLEFVIGDWLV